MYRNSNGEKNYILEYNTTMASQNVVCLTLMDATRYVLVSGLNKIKSNYKQDATRNSSNYSLENEACMER